MTVGKAIPICRREASTTSVSSRPTRPVQNVKSSHDHSAESVVRHSLLQHPHQQHPHQQHPHQQQKQQQQQKEQTLHSSQSTPTGHIKSQCSYLPKQYNVTDNAFEPPATGSRFNTLDSTSLSVPTGGQTNVKLGLKPPPLRTLRVRRSMGRLSPCMRYVCVTLALMLLMSSSSHARSTSRCRFPCRVTEFCDPGSNNCEPCSQICRDRDEGIKKLCRTECPDYISPGTVVDPGPKPSPPNPNQGTTGYWLNYLQFAGVAVVVLVIFLAGVVVVRYSDVRLRGNRVNQSPCIPLEQQSQGYTTPDVEQGGRLSEGRSLQGDVDIVNQSEGDAERVSLTNAAVVSDAYQEQGTTENGLTITHPSGEESTSFLIQA